MKYVIDKLPDLGIVKASVTGNLNRDTRKELFLTVVSEANKKF